MTHTISRAPDPRRPDITVTKRDFSTIEHLLSSHATDWSWRAVEFLVRELMRATVVDEKAIPADTVTMGSRVEYREKGRSSSQAVTLAYPGERDLPEGAVSILTPIGAALIGLAAGQSICYAGPDGRPVTIKIMKVHRPEPARWVRSEQPPRKMPARARSRNRQGRHAGKAPEHDGAGHGAADRSGPCDQATAGRC